MNVADMPLSDVFETEQFSNIRVVCVPPVQHLLNVFSVTVAYETQSSDNVRVFVGGTCFRNITISET